VLFCFSQWFSDKKTATRECAACKNGKEVQCRFFDLNKEWLCVTHYAEAQTRARAKLPKGSLPPQLGTAAQWDLIEQSLPADCCLRDCGQAGDCGPLVGAFCLFGGDRKDTEKQSLVIRRLVTMVLERPALLEAALGALAVDVDSRLRQFNLDNRVRLTANEMLDRLDQAGCYWSDTETFVLASLFQAQLEAKSVPGGVLWTQDFWPQSAEPVLLPLLDELKLARTEVKFESNLVIRSACVVDYHFKTWVVGAPRQRCGACKGAMSLSPLLFTESGLTTRSQCGTCSCPFIHAFA
jgi:hypothetical protein